MQPTELKALCKKYRQKKLTEAVEGDAVNDFLDETGDEVAEDDLGSTNGSTDNLNRIVRNIHSFLHIIVFFTLK